MFRPRDESSRYRGSTGRRSEGRGASELVAVVLLLLVVVLGSTVVAITGVGAIEDNKRTVDVSQAETSLQQLDSRSSDVTLGFDGETSEGADLRRGGGSEPFVTEREAWIQVTLEDTATDTVHEVVNQPMGSVVYRRDDTTLALEGGGVWRSDNGGAVMVSPPEFYVHDGTLTLPIVDISGDSSLGGPVRVRRTVPPERKFPDPDADPLLTNRLTEGRVVVTVHSNYYQAWGQFFEDTTNAWVRYDDEKKQVEAIFLGLPGWGSFGRGIVATSGPGELWLKGAGNEPAFVDSYDSSVLPDGSYTITRSNDGLVEAAGTVKLSGNSKINGTVRSGDIVEVGSTSVINGDVYSKNYPAITGGGEINGDIYSLEDVESIEQIDEFVNLSVEILQAENDNDATNGVIKDNKLDISGGSAKLDAGAYYLEHLTLNGQDLTLDTSDGDIYIGVRDYISLDEANLEVSGTGIVRIFVLSVNEVDVNGFGLQGQNAKNNLHLDPGSSVYVPGDRSPQLRVYGTEEMKVAIGGSEGNPTSFSGVIYAPAGLNGPSRVYVKKADVYGQIVTANLTLGQGGEVHYDLALQGVPLPRSDMLERLEFMHVAVHQVEVKERD